jgi:hypothetical protein
VSESVGMRTARALVPLVLAAVQPLCAFAASYHFEPDPVGEKVYTSGQLERVAVPITIIAGGFSVAWLLHEVRRGTRKLTQNNGGAHHC